MRKGEIRELAANGLIKQNPIFRLVLGTCPTLAISTAVVNGLGMGLSVTFVLIFSNLLVSLLSSLIPEKVRIPAYIMIIATFVTITSMVVEKFAPSLYSALGVYLPLITVNCIILSRAESFASSHSPIESAFDGLFMGLGFTLGITLISFVREVLGNGSIFGLELWEFNIGFFQKPAGAFFTFGLLLIIINSIYDKAQKRGRRNEYLQKYCTQTQEKESKSEVTE